MLHHAKMDIKFTNVTGRLSRDGEWAAILNPATQTYTLTAFHTGSGWDNGDPVLGYGQSAWFDLGGALPADLSSIPVVPEPSAIALGSLAIASLFVRRARAPSRATQASLASAPPAFRLRELFYLLFFIFREGFLKERRISLEKTKTNYECDYENRVRQFIGHAARLRQLLGAEPIHKCRE